MKDSTQDNLDRMRHSAAHIMAAAVCRLFENVNLDIGPATADGFYYDFDLPERLAPEDFERIEAEMAKMVSEQLPFERFESSREDAIKMLEEAGQKFKLERLADIPEGETISFYRCGDFVDLCRGPHLENTGQLRAFKLLSVAGSYYRGRETNPMLQRLYGTAFTNPKQLKLFLKQREEAAKRDHRKLGRELDLFSIQEDVGPGLVHWHPKGGRIRSVIESYWKDEHFRGGYELIYTPHIGKANLWETSGHLDFYRESMYAPMDIDGQEYFVKPMNCPFHIQIYKSTNRSYRELPLRWAELGTVYRYEKGGVLHGLLRVRGFTQDDAHIICTPDQVSDEIRSAVRFAMRMWKRFGFTDITAYLSTRPDKAVGEPERWDQATRALRDALGSEGLEYEVDEGGGAFYGPKIDLKVRDAIGREWQLGTVQFDFNLPERFDLSYTASDGKAHRPYMIHRALLGSLERFFGILIEHYAGAFPLWLAPEQVRILPITSDQDAYATALADKLRADGLRVSVDYSDDRIGSKIRRGRNERIPYLAVAGGREAESGQVAVRSRDEGELGPMDFQAFVERLKQEEASQDQENSDV